MSDDPNPQDRLLDLVFGLLPENEAEELRAEIEKDPTLAAAYAAVQADAELMGEAAKLQSPPIVLNLPKRNGRDDKMPAETIPAASGPELTPWSRWAQWSLVGAASLLVLLSFIGWAQRRSQLAGAGTGRLRIQVTGPSQLNQSSNSRYRIATSTVVGRPVATNVHFSVYSMDGDRLLGHTEKTGEDGTLRLDIPADLELPDTVRIEVEVGEDESRQVAESQVHVRREPLSTYVRLDRPQCNPGDTLRCRTVTLSRFHLEPDRELPVHFEILGPQGEIVAGSPTQTKAENGVATGEFVIPEDAPEGMYSLLVSSTEHAFEDVHREFVVLEPREAELQKDLEFAGIGYGPGMEVRAVFRATRRDGTAVANAAAEIVIKSGEETVYESSTTTDADGALAIGFRLPEEMGELETVLTVTIDDGTVRETLTERIPSLGDKITVDFFPEGGDLAAVGENRVYFAARDSDGNPVDLTGWIVDEAGNYYARVETMHEGRGMFRILPRVGVRYHLRLENPVNTQVDGRLPFVVPTQKVVLNAGAGVFQPGDPIEFNVRASQAGLPLVAMVSCRGVHVGEQAFLTRPSENGNGKAAANAVAISVPKSVAGVIRLAVFDYSTTPPKPVAERLVYRRPFEKLDVALAADRESYAPGQSCRLDVKVSDEKGQPVSALLGLSVVDEAVLEPAMLGPNTMSSYFWLTRQVEDPQDWEDADFLLEETPEAEVALDLLLGTQGWRRFVQPSVQRFRRDEMHGKPLGRWVDVDADATPPLMLDNLSSLLAKTDTAKARGSRSAKRGQLLAALVVLGGGALLVLVTMLSLLKVARGAWLWAPATSAVILSFFLVFLTLSPDTSTVRTVAFQSYRPADETSSGETPDEEPRSDKAEESTPDEVVETTGRTVAREYRKEAKNDLHAGTDSAPVPLWSPLLKADAKGHANVNFDLSDSATRYRVIADGHGSGRIGSAVKTIESNPPFQLSLELPEEVTLGDRIDLPVVIATESALKEEVRVSAETADGLQLIGSAEIARKLDGETSERHVFSAKAASLADRAIVRIRGQAGDHVDAVERAVRIVPTGNPQVTTMSGVLEDEKELTVVIPEDAVPGSVDVALTVYPTLNADLFAAIESVRGDQLDAAAATMTIADLSIDYLRQNSIADVEVLRKAKELRSESLLRLARFQDSDGGYSTHEESPPDAAATACVALVLQADQQLFGTRLSELNKAIEWLASRDSDQFESADRAWRLWALAESDQKDLGAEFDKVSSHALKAKDALQLALAGLAALALDADSADELLDALAEQQADDGHVAGSGVSDAEMTALAALAWLSQAPDSKPGQKAMGWLLSARDGAGGFRSNRATALAAGALVMADGDDIRVGSNAKLAVRLEGKTLDERTVAANGRRVIVLENLSDEFKSGKNVLHLNLPKGNRVPYLLTVRYNVPW